MAINSALEVAIISTNRYRADSLALALCRESEFHPVVVTPAEPARLACFPMALIEIDGTMEAALQLAHAVITSSSDAKVILLGLVESTESVVQLAEMGASGYASPATSLQELIAIMRSVQKGEFICTPAIAYTLFSHLAHLSNVKATRLPRSEVLTARERQVLELISQDFSNKEIAERLSLSTYTVKNHVHRILKKLQVHNRGHAFRYFYSELNPRTAATSFEQPGTPLDRLKPRNSEVIGAFCASVPARMSHVQRVDLTVNPEGESRKHPQPVLKNANKAVT